MKFPLFDKAVQAGVVQSGNGLIVAPTATGKSYIGRRVIGAALEANEKGVLAYLVSYRALASEMSPEVSQGSKPCQSLHTWKCLYLALRFVDLKRCLQHDSPVCGRCLWHLLWICLRIRFPK